MALNIRTQRPTISITADNGWQETPVIGTGAEWDWLFDELKDKLIASIKLIRQLNPGMSLKDAKETYEAMKPFRQHRYGC